MLRKVVTTTIPANTRWFPLQEYPEVIELRTAVLIDGNNRRYPLSLRGTLDSASDINVHSDYGVLVNNYDNLTPGRPQTVYFGKSTNEVEISPVSNAVYTIEMTTIVYPEDAISSASYPTIPERHHPAIAIGAAVRAHELDLYFDDNRIRHEPVMAAWQQALVRAAKEDSVISRDTPTVQFSNSYW
jgi:hypothetical protein